MDDYEDVYLHFESENDFFDAVEKDGNEGAVYVTAMQLMSTTVFLTYESGDTIFTFDYGSVDFNNIDSVAQHISERSQDIGRTTYRGFILAQDHSVRFDTVYIHGDIFSSLENDLNEYFDHIENDKVSEEMLYSLDKNDFGNTITAAIGQGDKAYVFIPGRGPANSEDVFLNRADQSSIDLTKKDSRDDVLDLLAKK